jgi:hypothetical protein
MGSENAHDSTQYAQYALAMTLSEQYHKDGIEFLNHVTRVTGYETWVLFVNV